MILSELYRLYGRLVAEGANVPQMGSSMQKVSFVIKLNQQGQLLSIDDYRDIVTEIRKGKKEPKETQKLLPRVETVPGESKPSGSGFNPCFLWDNAGYLLGFCDPEEDEKDGGKKRARVLGCFEATRSKYLQFEQILQSPYFSAVCRFLESWQPEQWAEHVSNTDILGSNGVFLVISNNGAAPQYLHKLPELREWWNGPGHVLWTKGLHNIDESPDTAGKELLPMCLITGERAPAALVHEPAIKGVVDAQSTGAKLVSFNCKAFDSYGKEQSVNAPVSKKAAFAYCNALNYLLSRASSRTRLADSTLVFWSDAPADRGKEYELLFGSTLNLDSMNDAAQDEDILNRVKNNLSYLAQGRLPKALLNPAEATRFCVLALAPNAARLSVRFFMESSFGDILRNLVAHHDALKLVKRHAKFNDPSIITPGMILRETARETKDIPPSYAGPLMRSILLNLPYPDSIAMAIVRRFRADRYINYIRCAYLKAWLIRKNPKYSITSMLDTSNTQVGYLLGRLFAALQKTQDDALGSVNRSLRDSFYASASVNPSFVFPRLMKLFNHHLSKLSGGLRVNREKLVCSIMAEIMTFPSRLSLEQQGLFALGFYHQLQSFFTPKSDTKDSSESSAQENAHSESSESYPEAAPVTHSATNAGDDDLILF